MGDMAKSPIFIVVVHVLQFKSQYQNRKRYRSEILGSDDLMDYERVHCIIVCTTKHTSF